jgi:hypothetical protein
VIQIPLPLDWRGQGGGDIIVGEPNRIAIDLLARPEIWPSHCTLLVGPPRSGRSMIAATLAVTPGLHVIDDADRAEEAALFHEWNRTREAGERLLLVAADAPPRWPVALPDLRSRLGAAGVARILPPDEDLTEALLMQGLSQAGSAFSPDVPRYLAQRLPRCYQTVEAALAALNADSLSSGRKITLQTARQILADGAILTED